MDINLIFDEAVTFYGSEISHISGLTDINYTHTTVDRADGLGQLVIGTLVNPRVIYLSVSMRDRVADSTLRYFKRGVVHTLRVGGRSTECRCEHAALDFDNGFKLHPTLSLTLFCADPYFYAHDDFGQNLAGVQPLFGFPWTPTKKSGIACGYRIFSDTTIFHNTGDEVVGIRVVFKATRGTATDPSFINQTTGKAVRLKGVTLNKGDTLELSTIKGDKYVKLNGVSVYAKVTRDSDIVYMLRGDNRLKFDAETGFTNIDVYLHYRPKYLSGLEVDSESLR